MIQDKKVMEEAMIRWEKEQHGIKTARKLQELVKEQIEAQKTFLDNDYANSSLVYILQSLVDASEETLEESEK